MTETLPPLGTDEYFEEVHARFGDPFGLLERPYEKRKRAITLAMLGVRRYRRCFEPGCSIGVLTEQLAARCDEVVAADSSPSAVTEARRRLGHLSSVRVERRRLPKDWPEGVFDLVVLGEIGYYFSPSELDAVSEKVASALEGGGHLLAVHWRPPIANCSLHGEEVHAVLRERTGLIPLASYREELFVAELFSQGPRGALPTPEGG